MKDLNSKEPVRLRKKEISKGRLSLYLDYYQSGNRQYEFLKLYILKSPKTPLERQSNNETIALAQAIKTKRAKEFQYAGHDIPIPASSKTNFIEYFETYLSNYTKQDKRTLKACLEKFKKFLNEIGKQKILAKEINANLLIDFKDYLEETLNGETPQTYFNRFKKVINYAYASNLFSKSPIPKNLKFKKTGISKAVFSLGDLNKLKKTRCGNSDVRRAFLFACNTGLRWGDIITIKWENIDNGVLILNQKKTAEVLNIPLNKEAKKQLGKKKSSDSPIFNLPSFTGSLKTLKNWIGRAKIEKSRITWHSARHSFATNLLLKGIDIKTVSKLLGHTSIQHTMRYLEIVDERKVFAVNSLD